MSRAKLGTHNLILGTQKKTDTEYSESFIQRDFAMKILLLTWLFKQHFRDRILFIFCLNRYCEAQARVRQGLARDGSQGERP